MPYSPPLFLMSHTHFFPKRTLIVTSNFKYKGMNHNPLLPPFNPRSP